MSQPEAESLVEGSAATAPRKKLTRREAAVSSTRPFLTVSADGGRGRTILDPNTKLDRFVVRRHLGSGGLGDVYLAWDTVRSEEVAIKVVDGRKQRVFKSTGQAV